MILLSQLSPRTTVWDTEAKKAVSIESVRLRSERNLQKDLKESTWEIKCHTASHRTIDAGFLMALANISLS
jgi:Leu/Phe-tRNA-protein transferase